MSTPDRAQEIRAELMAEFVAWLVKKAREHRAQGPQYAKQADVIGKLASKVQRGAVRPNNLLSLPPQGGPEDVPALLAEVGRLSDELTGSNLALYEEELDNARLRLALASAQRGRRELRARVAELETQAGTSPWERAVAGLNALADADIAFWIEPDGHISGPFGDEHIEWDQKASRWRLVHDDEDELAPPEVTP